MQTDATRRGPPIRVARLRDAQPLAALAERAFRDAFAADNSPQDMDAYVRAAFSLARIRDELADASNTFLLAYPGEAAPPSGYAKLRAGPADLSVSGPDPIELQRLYVAHPAIGRGVGAMLMRASLEAARAAGYRTLWLGVWEHNQRAISFYERWRFTIVGDHAFRLGSDDQRDLVMTRPVDGPP